MIDAGPTTLNEEEWHHGTLINDDLIIEIMFYKRGTSHIAFQILIFNLDKSNSWALYINCFPDDAEI